MSNPFVITDLTIQSVNVALLAVNKAQEDQARKLSKIMASIGANNGEETLFDIVHPIGEPYTQYPGMLEPNELYSVGEWEDITADYAGLFFRAEGESAGSLPFGSIQEEGLPNCTGTMYQNKSGNRVDGHTHTGVFSDGGAAGKGNNAISGNSTTKFNFSLADGEVHDGAYENLVYGYSDHVTPRNTAIRIWKRIK